MELEACTVRTSSLGGPNESIIVWPRLATWWRSIRLPISPIQSKAKMCCQSERGRCASWRKFSTRKSASATGCVTTKEATACAMEWCAVLCRPGVQARAIKEASRSPQPRPEPDTFDATKAWRKSSSEASVPPWSRGERSKLNTSGRIGPLTPAATRSARRCCWRASDVSKCSVSCAMCRSDSDSSGGNSLNTVCSSSGLNAALFQNMPVTWGDHKDILQS